MAANTIVMSMETDPAIAQPAALSHALSGRKSFAQSFGERVAMTMGSESDVAAKLNPADVLRSSEAKSQIVPGMAAPVAAVENSNAVPADIGRKQIQSRMDAKAVVSLNDVSQDTSTSTAPVADEINANESAPPANDVLEVAPEEQAPIPGTSTEAAVKLSAANADAAVAPELLTGNVAPSSTAACAVSNEKKTFTAVAKHESGKATAESKEPRKLKNTKQAERAVAVAPPSTSATALPNGASAQIALRGVATSGNQSPAAVSVQQVDLTTAVVGAKADGARQAKTLGKPSMKPVAAAGSGNISASGRAATPQAGAPSVPPAMSGEKNQNTAAPVAGMSAGAISKAAPDSAAHVADKQSGAAPVSAPVSGPISAPILGTDSVHAVAGGPSTTPQSGDTSVHVALAHAVAADQSSSGSAMLQGVDAGHRTLTVTPKVLEVGVANGVQGWVKVRAELTGDGAVNASLSTASQAGQEMLHRELPSLTAYLQQERIAVNTVAVHTAAVGDGLRGAPGGMGGNASGPMEQGNGSSAGERGVPQGTVMGAARDVLMSGSDEESAMPMLYAGVGGWLSIRA